MGTVLDDWLPLVPVSIAPVPSLDRPYADWVFATRLHDAAWLAHDLDVLTGLARVTADTTPRGH